jgi:hypothetical protein
MGNDAVAPSGPRSEDAGSMAAEPTLFGINSCTIKHQLDMIWLTLICSERDPLSQELEPGTVSTGLARSRPGVRQVNV